MSEQKALTTEQIAAIDKRRNLASLRMLRDENDRLMTDNDRLRGELNEAKKLAQKYKNGLHDSIQLCTCVGKTGRLCESCQYARAALGTVP